MSAERRGEWFLSSTGRQIWPLDFRPEDIEIESIAHSLAHICRFGGHCREFYSVAQHSVYVAELVDTFGCETVSEVRRLKLLGLLHDAPEAIIGDVVRPLKRSVAMSDYRTLEVNIWLAFCQRFGFSEVIPEAVVAADCRILQTERRDLCAPHPWAWKEDQIAMPLSRPYEIMISPWSTARAKSEFLGCYYRLMSSTRQPQEASL